MVKVKYIIPPGLSDLWQDVPALKLSKEGIWSRKRLTRGPTGVWRGSGRMSKKYYNY